MMAATKLAKNHASSTTTTTTFEGRTEVDVRELLKKPNVQKLIQQVAENTPVEGKRDNGSSESLSCTISDTAQTCSDTTDSFIAAQGDLLDIQVTVSGAVSSLVIAETAVFSVS